MSVDILASLSNPQAAAKFASSFLSGYLSPAFGTRTKTEIDALVFSCLIEAGALDPAAEIYEIARALEVTPARVRRLLISWELRSTPTQKDLREAIVAALKKTRFSNDGNLLTFGVEDPLLKEDIVARLKRRGVFADSSFAKELVKLPADAFVEFLDEIVDADTKREVTETLVKDKQIADASFKAFAKGVLVALGEKVANDAGGKIAGRIGDFLDGLLTKNVAKAVGAVTDEIFAKLRAPRGVAGA